MSGKIASILADLRDQSKYVLKQDVDLFDEHSDVAWTKDGEQVPEGTPGAKRKVHRFDKAALERIAARCNDRDATTGTLAILTLGHTIPDEPDESKQPPPVGYAHGYRVAYDKDRKRWMLRADFYIRRDKYAEAESYPRTSIELWPGDEEVDPIALLRRTPARSVQWVYHRDGRWASHRGGRRVFHRGGRLALRYHMEFAPMHDEHTAPGHDEMSHEDIERFERHCASHPLYAKYHAHKARMYAMQDEPPAEPPLTPADPPEPEEPVRHAAAFPSATNATLPTKPHQHARPAAPAAPDNKAEQYRREAESIRASAMERKVEALERFAKDAQRRADESEARRIVGQLVAEGYEIDAAEEVPALMGLDEAGRERRVAQVRRFHRLAVESPVGRVPIDGSRPARNGDAGQYDPEDPEAMSLEDQQRVLQYQRKHGLHGKWDEAVKAVFPERCK